MSRVNKAVPSRAKRKKLLKMAKGFRGMSKNCIRIAKQAVERSLVYAYTGRKDRKAQMRALWIQRINAATRQRGMKYSEFMFRLKSIGVNLDRKVLADLAVSNESAFDEIYNSIKQ